MANYIQNISSLLAGVVETHDDLLVYGENIDNGSRIVGICRGLAKDKNYKLVNVGNYENTHIGLGLGFLLRGGKSILVAKQLDFMLLGLDQLVNTLNSLREMPNQPEGSFTILTVVCDQGFQGPQSSFNSAADLASLCRIPIFCLNNKHEANTIMKTEIGKVGFRLMLLSQKAFGCEQDDFEAPIPVEKNAGFKYSSGDDGVIFCSNFSLLHGLSIKSEFENKGYNYSTYSLNYSNKQEVEKLIRIEAKKNNAIFIDDSKSLHCYSDSLAFIFKSINSSADVKVLKRPLDISFGVGNDLFQFDKPSI